MPGMSTAAGSSSVKGGRVCTEKLHISMLPAGLIILSSVLCRCLPAG